MPATGPFEGGKVMCGRTRASEQPIVSRMAPSIHTAKEKKNMLGSVARRIGSGVIGAAVGFAALGPVQTAEAQMRMGAGMGVEMFAPAMSARELDKLAAILRLTPDQKEAASTLLSAYRDEHAKVSKAMRDAMREAQAEFQESQDPAVFTKDLPEKMTGYRERMKSLEAGFMNDLKSLLDAKQSEQWPRAERAHRREKSLPGGMLAGESVNLVNIVTDLRIEGQPSRELEQAIESYEVDLDRAMSERDAKREEMQRKQEESMKDFDFSKIDFDQIRKMMTEYRSAGLKVRDVNDRHARLIAAALPDSMQADFTRRVRTATFPQVYREPYPSKAIAVALGFDDLKGEQRSSIEEMKAVYERELASANEAWASAIAAEEKDGGGDPFGGFGRMMPGGGGEESAVEAARKARRELDKNTINKLKQILSEEQRERLPEREVENPWGMMGGGRGGDDDAGGEAPRRERRRN